MRLGLDLPVEILKFLSLFLECILVQNSNVVGVFEDVGQLLQFYLRKRLLIESDCPILLHGAKFLQQLVAGFVEASALGDDCVTIQERKDLVHHVFGPT